MDKDKIFDLYEKVYYRDLDEVNSLFSRFPILITGVALIINAYIFLLRSDGFLALPKLIVIPSAIVVLAVMIYLLYCLFMAFKAREYRRIENLDQLDRYRSESIQYEKDISKYNKDYPEAQQDIPDWREMFRDNLEKSFIECSKRNNDCNEDRRKWFHRSLRWLWINLCLCTTILISIILITLWM